MKIGLFTDTFYPEINGVATSCLNLQRELTRRGHEVHVYAPKCKGWEENQRENVHYLASAPLLVLKDRNFAFPTPLTSWEAEKIDFDVVHTNSEFVMGMFGHHVAGSLGCAQVHTYHTVWGIIPTTSPTAWRTRRRARSPENIPSGGATVLTA